MNCEEIKNRLSEYLDGELDERESKLVGDHLENCPGCAEELAGLKEYFKSIDSLEKAEPPPDFLRQVHARLEGQSVFKTTIKKLVFPIRFKIPLEVAGLAAAAMLILYIMNLSPEKQSAKLIPLAASMRTRPETERLPEKSGAVQPRPYPEKLKERAVGRWREPAAPPAYNLMELDQAAPLSVLQDEVGGGGPETIAVVLLIEPEIRYAEEKSGRGTPLLGMKAKNLQASEAAATGVTKDKMETSSPLARLKDLITREGGEIISTEDQTDLIRRISIKLPPDRYRSFMEKLSGISNLQPEQWSQVGDAEQTFRIRLTGTMPEN